MVTYGVGLLSSIHQVAERATRMRISILALAFAAALPVGAAAEVSWLGDRTVQQRLAAGEIVIRADVEPDAQRGRIAAAIRINAPPESIWSVLTDCEHASAFVPGLKRCRLIEHAADGSHDLIEHEVKYSWLMPTIRCVLRANYQRPLRLDFHRIDGDMREEEGSWRLERQAGSRATIVEYRLYVDPGFWIPQALVRHSLRVELPAALAALRSRVEAAARAPR